MRARCSTTPLPTVRRQPASKHVWPSSSSGTAASIAEISTRFPWKIAPINPIVAMSAAEYRELAPKGVFA
jgi:hypothetical protein